jgi:hypothetical protein
MLAGAANTEPLAGEEIETVGAALPKIVTAAEVVATPLLSVARAVSVCVPALRLARVVV